MRISWFQFKFNWGKLPNPGGHWSFKWVTFTRRFLANVTKRAGSLVTNFNFWEKTCSQMPSHILLFETPWTAAHQAFLSLTISRSLPEFRSTVSVTPCSRHILSYALLLLPSIFPGIRVLPNESLFASGDQNTGASASVLPMSFQGWFPLGWTGLISLQSRGLWRVSYKTTVWKHQFFGYPYPHPASPPTFPMLPHCTGSPSHICVYFCVPIHVRHAHTHGHSPSASPHLDKDAATAVCYPMACALWEANSQTDKRAYNVSSPGGLLISPREDAVVPVS